MKLLSNMKIRSKLLALVIPPCLLFLFFASWIVLDLVGDVQTNRWNKNLRNAFLPFEELNEALQDEEFNSTNHLIEDESERLKKVRVHTDRKIIYFKEAMHAIETEELSFLALYEERILSDLTTLSTIRSKVDSKEITSHEIADFYGAIQKNSLDAMGGIDKLYRIQPDFLKPYEAYYDLLHEKYYFQRQSAIAKGAIIDDTITADKFAKLNRNMEAEIIYHSEFEGFATPFQLRTYYEVMANPSTTQIKEMLETIQELNIKGGYGIDPEAWAIAEEHKIGSFRQLINTLQDHLNEATRKALVKDIVQLSVIIFVTLILLFLILILAWRIIKDIVGPLAILSTYSIELGNKNLSASLKTQDRKDELGILHNALVQLGQNLGKIIMTLKNEADAIAQSSSQIVSTITELATGQKETENAAIEANTTMEELRQASQISAAKAKQVLDLANETLEPLKSSSAAIRATIGDLSQIQEKMGIITESTTKLNEHCQAIGTIIDSVHDLAEQSHVLAVNASIEAAKAGEQGKGFAVVAQEVKNLAEQSKQATTRVHGILTDIQNAMNTTVLATEQGSLAVKKGVDQSANTTDFMRHLSQNVETITQAAHEISSSNEQQYSAVSQSTEALSNIKSASSQQTEQVRGVEQSIFDLHKVAETLEDLFKEFKIPSEQPKQENKDGQR